MWFYGVFLMAQTRCDISAKQLERELSVTYKTAWRMFHQIRSMLCEDGGLPGEDGHPLFLTMLSRSSSLVGSPYPARPQNPAE